MTHYKCNALTKNNTQCKIICKKNDKYCHIHNFLYGGGDTETKDIISPDGIDNINEFMKAYRKHIRVVSAEAMINEMGLPPDSEEFSDPVLLDAKICWMVTFNMQGLLDLKKIRDLPSKLDINDIINELKLNHAIVIWQDELDEKGKELGQDHHFIVIGDHGKAHIIEHLPNECNAVYTDTIENIAKLLIDIQNAETPDRFYEVKAPHAFKGNYSIRKQLSAKTVMDYITSK